MPETKHPWLAHSVDVSRILAWDDTRQEVQVTIASLSGTDRTHWLLIIENGEPRLERITPEAKDGAK